MLFLHIHTLILIGMGCGSSKDGGAGGKAVGTGTTATDKPTTKAKQRKESVLRPAPVINVTYGANVQMLQPPHSKVIFIFGMHICMKCATAFKCRAYAVAL